MLRGICPRPKFTTGLTGPIVVHFECTGLNTGLVAAGTITNATIAAAILANPENYYVNVHTTVCQTGTVRGNSGNHPHKRSRLLWPKLIFVGPTRSIFR